MSPITHLWVLLHLLCCKLKPQVHWILLFQSFFLVCLHWNVCTISLHHVIPCITEQDRKSSSCDFQAHFGLELMRFTECRLSYLPHSTVVLGLQGSHLWRYYITYHNFMTPCDWPTFQLKASIFFSCFWASITQKLLKLQAWFFVTRHHSYLGGALRAS